MIDIHKYSNKGFSYSLESALVADLGRGTCPSAPTLNPPLVSGVTFVRFQPANGFKGETWRNEYDHDLTTKALAGVFRRIYRHAHFKILA